MKILLTGAPKSGKTTLIANLIKGVRLKCGMLAKEEVADGKRVGFSLSDAAGNITTLARADVPPTNYPVGRFFVDLASLDGFTERLLEYGSNDLLFIDEVGQMQLYSEKFKQLVRSYLASNNDFIGTISAVYEHPFIDEVKPRPDVLVCTVTPENRRVLRTVLPTILANGHLFNATSIAQKRLILTLAREYLQAGHYTSLKKLFHNALRYIAEGRVKRLGGNTFLVGGDHAEHSVRVLGEDYQCDCDFFNGRGQFENQAGECSHIQAAKLTLLK